MFADSYDTDHPQALKYLCSHALKSNSLSWRHHGIGCLQAYLHEGDTETRIHIWHPSLLMPGMGPETGLVHDHRFGFDSYVVLGAIYNEEFTFITDDENGEWVMHGVTHARKAKQETGDYNAPLGLEDETAYRAVRLGKWHQEGNCYSMKPRDFHLTIANRLAVTIIVKTALVDGSARIARKADKELVHAFEHPENPGLYVEIIDMATEALQGKVPA